MNYLDGLNERQKEAVLASEGPVSVLAGAGSGKTRVLTTRIYHLIRNGVAPESILAVTFTNKAAREMRERLGAQLGQELTAWRRGSLPFVATFHGLGRELLEQYGRPLNIPRNFTIFDRDDSERAIKEALKSMGIDPKEVAPRSILSRISRAKNDGYLPAEFSEKFAREHFRTRMVADAWRLYQETLAKEKALDFDDLLTLPVKLLEEHADVRALVQDRFKYIHIDEFQDTNEIQGRLVSLMAGTRQNVMVVGDIDQCVIAGTEITMADGSTKPVESVSVGDTVLSNYGSGSLRAARVTDIMKREAGNELIRITTKEGRTLTSTPEHAHFAGYRIGLAPQMHFTYLMYKRNVGWRLGVSQTYTRGQRQAIVGFQQRSNQEHADELWVVGTHQNSQDARVEEYTLSLSYGIPTLPFVARKGSLGGYVHDQEVLDRVFRSFDTEAAALRLLADRGFSKNHPHHRAQATRSDRRNIIVTLCGDRRGASPLHRISVVGSDATGKNALEHAGFSVRSAKLGSKSWRFETGYADFKNVHETVMRLLSLFPDARVVETARLGGKKLTLRGSNSLPFLPAASVLPGMAMFNEETGYDLVEKVERIPASNQAVYDLNVERTHNFIANGLHTHNCIYTWRGATIDNLLEFEKKFENAKTIILEHNYRSSKNIVDAANQIIEHNRNRKEKKSVTDNGAGEPITLMVAETAESEAAWIAREAARLVRNGMPVTQIAVLFRTNFQSRGLEEAFLAEGLPYRLLGTRFFDRKEVKDVLSWVRLALDPTREADRIRAVQFPARGIGKVLLGKLVAGLRDELKPSESAKVAKFEAILTKLGEAADTLTPSAFVRQVITDSGIEAAFEEEGTEEDLERLANAKELATLASRHDEMPGRDGIAAFLADAALAGDQDEMDRPQEAKKEGVTLMTVHAAKGLEFDAVFVTGMEEGLFPHEAREDEERDEEEERRLFYVAVTRARSHLYLTLAHIRRIYGTDYINEPSSFIRDIDESLVQYAQPHAPDNRYDISY